MTANPHIGRHGDRRLTGDTASDFSQLVRAALEELVTRSRFSPSLRSLHWDRIAVTMPAQGGGDGIGATAAAPGRSDRATGGGDRAVAEAIARAIFRALGGTE